MEDQSKKKKKPSATQVVREIKRRTKRIYSAINFSGKRLATGNC